MLERQFAGRIAFRHSHRDLDAPAAVLELNLPVEVFCVDRRSGKLRLASRKRLNRISINFWAVNTKAEFFGKTAHAMHKYFYG